MGKKREKLMETIIDLQTKEIERLKGEPVIETHSPYVNRLGGTEWATAPTCTLIDLLNEHYEGKLSIYDYWEIGDERKIELGGEIGQTIQMVLTDKKTNELVNGVMCAFSVDQKNCLEDIELPMNDEDTNENGWDGCKMRKWLTDVYANAFPNDYRKLFKRFVTEPGVVDLFALRSEMELFGKNIYSFSDGGRQIEYYKKTRNRVKLNGSDDSGSANYWWERSPCSGNSTLFCGVISDGSADRFNASSASGLAPFGCI